MQIGIEGIVAYVGEDHADAASLLHRQTLVDAVIDSTIALDDLARDLGRVKLWRTGPSARKTETDRSRVCAGQASIRRQN